ncbi:MAG TPA: penicillin-binding protein 2 [Candidatus Paceibacterota bacterium]|nr:penicillin-binding protein 2 [Candidatus Paceibacterota bacterium]
MKSGIILRTRILCGIFIAIALLLIVRLYFVQVVHGDAYQAEGNAQYIQTDPGASGRGEIYFTTKDGQFVAAAVSLSGYSVAINPKVLTDSQKAYTALNAIVPIDEPTFTAAAKNTNSSFIDVADHLDDAQAAQVEALNLSGIIISPQEWREYPGGNLAAQVLGFVGYDGTSTIRVGEYGLEKEYDSTLTQSSSGLYVNPFAEIFANIQDAVSFNPSEHQGSVITTIEPNVQSELQKTLDQIMKQYTPVFDGGIIMNPHTGEIYAMAMDPTFDPNNYSVVSEPSVYKNDLVSGRYELGSIMKPLTMAAGIDSGAITASTTYNDTGCITVSGAQVCNWDFKPRGVIPMGQILDQSLNVGASWVATQTGYPTFTKYMKSYGLGSSTGIDLPDEQIGDLSNLDDGSGPAVNFDTAAFGQGITVTPIEMIRALSALANNGVLPTPHVVSAIQYESGITRSISYPEGPQVLKPTTAHTLTSMLETVYDNYELNGEIKMEHYTAAAKTGTAQIPDPATGTYFPGSYYIHSFFGYFPASNPQFIVFLYAYHPIGQEYSAYTWDEPYYQLEQYLINYYNIPPDR